MPNAIRGSASALAQWAGNDCLARNWKLRLRRATVEGRHADVGGTDLAFVLHADSSTARHGPVREQRRSRLSDATVPEHAKSRRSANVIHGRRARIKDRKAYRKGSSAGCGSGLFLRH